MCDICKVLEDTEHFLFHCDAYKAKAKKLCGSGNPTLPTILVATLIFFVLFKFFLKKSRYCSVQLAIRFGTVR